MQQEVAPRAKALARAARKEAEDAGWWAHYRETWLFLRTLWEMHGIVLEFGEYSALWRAVRTGQAERMVEVPAIFRVTHERTGQAILVMANRWSLNRTVRRLGSPEERAREREEKAGKARARAEARAKREAEWAEYMAQKRAREAAQPPPPLPLSSQLAPQAPQQPARAAHAGGTLRLANPPPPKAPKPPPPRLEPPPPKRPRKGPPGYLGLRR
jgi:hypothetical protein